MERPFKSVSVPTTKIRYPGARRIDKRSNFFGIEVLDPFRWMEEDSPELQRYLTAQNKLATTYLEGYPNRDTVKACVQKLYFYTKSYCPKKAGTKYITCQKLGLKEQEVLVVQDDLSGTPRILVDPNQNSPDGSVALTSWEPSPNGDILVYLESQSGCDWRTARFKRIDTLEQLPDTLENIKFTRLSWTKDNLGVIYSCYPGATRSTGTNYDRNDFQELYYHPVGTSQEHDILLVSFPSNPDYRSPGQVSTCGTYLVVTPQRSCTVNLLYFIDLTQWLENGRPQKPPLIPVIETWESINNYLGTSSINHYFLTNKNASNFRVVAINLNSPQLSSWIEILPEKKRHVLEWCQIVQSYLFASYLTDVKSTLQVHSLEDGLLLQSFQLDIGSILYGPSDPSDDEFFFMFVSFDTPGRVYRIDLRDSSPLGTASAPVTPLPKKSRNLLCFKCAECQRPKLAGPFKVDLFSEAKFLNSTTFKIITKQVWISSKDATQVPMYVSYCARIKPKRRVCLLSAYGAHGVILKPSYNPLYAAFMMHMDGIVAVVNARGGGEFGQRWFDGGSKLNKQNTFDDIIAGAEFLIKEKYTTKSKLIILGTSSGGLAAAVCVNQRPDIFSAAIINVGILDMMRFHKFTIGHNWIDDYGSPENKMEALNLLLYSPYHNVVFPEEVGVQYPAILVLTAEEDDRVIPCHSYKYVAELQMTIGRDPRQTKPILIRVEPKAGHGYGKPMMKLVDETTDMLCFMSYAVKQKFN